MRRNGSWAITFLKIKGIPIRVHLTFFLFLAWVAMEASERGESPLPEVLFVVTLFGCVLLHELGHALMARLFRVRTRDIVLYPFGGVATVLDNSGPKGELFITIAGPMVNVIIASCLFPFIVLPEDIAAVGSINFVTRVFIANVILVIFNLIPAYPMDGGRIFRASLMLLKVRAATVIAARVGQVISILLAIFAVYSGNIILILIAGVVFSNAMQEIMRERTTQAALGFRVRDVMNDISSLQVLHHGMTISQALGIALKSLQASFPVVLGENVIGVVDKQDLLQMAAGEPEEAYISEIMAREFVALRPDEELTSITEQVKASPLDALLVIDNGRLVGMLHKERLLEFLLVHGLRKHTQTSRAMNENS